MLTLHDGNESSPIGKGNKSKVRKDPYDLVVLDLHSSNSFNLLPGSIPHY